MNNNEMEQGKIKKAPGRKFIITAVVLLILITPIINFIYLKSRPDPASEKAIREAAAFHYNKDPNVLTNKDFATMTELTISNNTKFINFASQYDFSENAQSFIYMPDTSYKPSNPPHPLFDERFDIELLDKFTNLQELNLGITVHGGSYTPDTKTQELLKKLGILKKYEPLPVIDLSPIENLSNLRELKLFGVPFQDINPLGNLSDLENLWIETVTIESIEPLGKLKKLRNLTICYSLAKDIEPLRNLTNLEFLSFERSMVSDFKPISDLPNLKILKIRDNDSIKDIKSLKGMNNLKKLYIQDCPNITEQQIEDLQKALPNLEIVR